MNVANLQLQGLLMAIASINNALVHKGVLNIDEVDLALQKAEANLTSEERMFEDMTPPQRDAVCFPIRLLKRPTILKAKRRCHPFPNWSAWLAKRKTLTTTKCDPIYGDAGPLLDAWMALR